MESYPMQRVNPGRMVRVRMSMDQDTNDKRDRKRTQAIVLVTAYFHDFCSLEADYLVSTFAGLEKE